MVKKRDMKIFEKKKQRESVQRTNSSLLVLPEKEDKKL